MISRKVKNRTTPVVAFLGLTAMFAITTYSPDDKMLRSETVDNPTYSSLVECLHNKAPNNQRSCYKI